MDPMVVLISWRFTKQQSFSNFWGSLRVVKRPNRTCEAVPKAFKKRPKASWISMDGPSRSKIIWWIRIPGSPNESRLPPGPGSPKKMVRWKVLGKCPTTNARTKTGLGMIAWICCFGDFLRILPWVNHHLLFSNHLKQIQDTSPQFFMIELPYSKKNCLW